MDLVEVVCRQTSYTKEEAETKLKQYDQDLEKVLREFIEPKPTPVIVPTDANQVIYAEINNFMKPVFNKPLKPT
jgi:hypothetical protein